VEWHAALPMLAGDAVYRGTRAFGSSFSTSGRSSPTPSSTSPRFETLATKSSGSATPGRGKGSGVEIELPSTSIYTLLGRKVIAIRMFREHDQALEAGLRE
jgi:hypothetical protein